MDAKIGFTLFHFQNARFGFFDGCQDRRDPYSVLVNAHTQIDLGRIRVTLECLGQAQDGIGRRWL